MSASIRNICAYLCVFLVSAVMHAQAPKYPRLPGQSVTVLSDGRILVAGGDDHGAASSSVYIVDGTGAINHLASGLISARESHTATALPDGTVLVFGGTDGKGHYARTMELFDPGSQRFTQLSGLPLVPRATHTATLLTDGTVVVIGGTEEGGTVPTDIQTWDFRTGTVHTMDISPLFPRQGHTAALLSDGTVLISGGIDSSGNPVKDNEIYHPNSHFFQSTGQNGAQPDGPIALAETIPIDGDSQFSVADYLKLRFTALIDVASVTAQSLQLTTSNGTAIPVTIAAAEGGRLAFVIPSATLDPATDYKLSISGVKDLNGNVLSSMSVRFHTAGDVDDGTADSWIPDSDALAGNWNSKTEQSKWQKLPPLKAAAGVTAIAGQVLGLSGRPIPHVGLQIGSTKAETDNSGRFLLANLKPGRQILVIDGMNGNRPTVEYGQYEVAVDVQAGVTTALNYTIWLTKLDTAHSVHIPSPTTAADTVIRTPLLPGLELHLPAGTTIVSRDGKPVTDLTITPIPLDKPPFPLPTGVRVPIYFTIQPGLSEIRIKSSAGISTGAQLYYPNSFGSPAGMNYDFWNYDATTPKGWYIYGTGIVNPEKTQIIPNPGVYVYELTGAMVGSTGPKPPKAPTGPPKGDPVSVSSGEFISTEILDRSEIAVWIEGKEGLIPLGVSNSNQLVGIVVLILRHVAQRIRYRSKAPDCIEESRCFIAEWIRYSDQVTSRVCKARCIPKCIFESRDCTTRSVGK